MTGELVISRLLARSSRCRRQQGWGASPAISTTCHLYCLGRQILPPLAYFGQTSSCLGWLLLSHPWLYFRWNHVKDTSQGGALPFPALFSTQWRAKLVVFPPISQFASYILKLQLMGVEITIQLINWNNTKPEQAVQNKRMTRTWRRSGAEQTGSSRRDTAVSWTHLVRRIYNSEITSRKKDFCVTLKSPGDGSRTAMGCYESQFPERRTVRI